MSSQQLPRRSFIICGIASCLAQPALAGRERLKLPNTLAPRSWIKESILTPTVRETPETAEKAPPASPVVSDSQRADRRGDRKLIVRPRIGGGDYGRPVNVVFYSEGRYFDDVNSTINYAFRDWRTDETYDIKRGLLNFQWLLREALGTDEPFFILSGYRSPRTNAMLRRKSKNVAKNSLHMKGQASDLRLKSRSVRQISGAARSLKLGGVGKYSTSDFTHIDCGSVRTWGV